jgi:hypothetical protein
VNVPVFMGAGAVSVKVLIVELLSPSRASFVPEAEIQVVVPEVRISPVPVAVHAVRRSPGQQLIVAGSPPFHDVPSGVIRKRV